MRPTHHSLPLTRYDHTAALLTQLTWPEGNRYQWGYDEAGRVVSLRDPEDQITALRDLEPHFAPLLPETGWFDSFCVR